MSRSAWRCSVLEADLVEVVRGALFGAAALDATLGHVVRQPVRRHVVLVVHAPGDDGAVRIAVEEVDDDLLSDAGDVNGAPLLAGPHLRHPHPDRRVLVALAQSIPVELYLHPAVLVRVDLLVIGSDHQGGLRSLDTRLEGGACRMEGG